MSKQRWVVLGAALIGLGAALVAFLRPGPSSPSGLEPSAAASATATAAGAERPERERAAVDLRRPTPLLESTRQPESANMDLVTRLRTRYGQHLHSPYVQVKMLEELMRYFQKRNPTGWEAELLALVRQTFPELYDELEAMLHHRVEYEQWVRENEGRLRGLGDAERRAAMWEARERIYGKEAAEQIWASERKNHAVQEVLATLDTKTDQSLGDKLAEYRNGLKAVHGEQMDTVLERHRQELMNNFLDLSSVQKQLGALAPEERAKSLRELRKGMGLDEEALSRWETLDQTRDARWETGAAYMEERAVLARKYTGAELEARQAELRTRYFGDEAETVASEEQSGFFRFERERRWGRN